MADFFSFKCKDLRNGNWGYADIPYSNCTEGVELIIYEVNTRNMNQLWVWDENKIVSKMNRPRFCFGVREIKAGTPVILHDRFSSDSQYSDGWVFDEGYIKLENHSNLCIGLSVNKLVLQDINSNFAVNTWEAQAFQQTAKPASSCHLWYLGIPAHVTADSWTIENSVTVKKKSTDCTYYCVVGWGPAGYAGIQQVPSDNRVVIFSMWNDGHNNVRDIEHGPGVRVETFGGEGTGMKSMKSVPWKENEKVTIRVTGRKVSDEEGTNSNTWRCTGMYSLDGTTWHLVATYERTGKPPFNHKHFYSFVEDWRRDNKHEGHLIQRVAEYSDTKVVTDTGEVFSVKEANFTCQDYGDDGFAHYKAFGAVSKKNSAFVLSTGGMTGKDIFGSLASDGYEQRTKHQRALLSL